jgi:hypothetical protein
MLDQDFLETPDMIANPTILSMFRYVFFSYSNNNMELLTHRDKIVSTPDLRIVDYSVGLPGSQHDATAFAETRIYKEREVLLGEDEWMWADTAYPLHGWCQAPYKAYVLCFNFIVKDIIETFILDLKRTLKRTPLTTTMFPNFASDLSMQLAISRVPGNLYGDCEYALTMRTISDMQLFGLSPAFTFKLSFLVINKE